MKNERILSPIKWLVQSFYLICFVFPYSEDESRLRRNVSKAVDIVIIFFLLYVILTDSFLAFHQTAGKPVGFLITALSGDFCSLSIRIVLIVKKRYVIKTLRKLFSLYEKLETERGIKRNVASLTFAFAMSWVIPFILYTKTARLAMTKHGARETQMNVLFGTHFEANWGIMWVLIINLFLDQQLYAMPGYVAGLCYYTYKVLTDIIKSVEKNLTRKPDLGALYNAYMTLSCEVINCIDEVEHALSLLLFLLYIYITSFIFIIITLLIRIAPYSLRPDFSLINSTNVFIAFVAFFALSFQSVYVHKASVHVARVIHRKCSLISWPTDENEDAIRFLLLTASDTFPTKVLITGWNMFDLNQDFILQTTGAIVSYGTIVSQLGKDTM